jgi:RimJ/RimL family protein N-acetyltransferase
MPDARGAGTVVVIGEIDEARPRAIPGVGEGNCQLAVARGRVDQQKLTFPDVEAAANDRVRVALQLDRIEDRGDDWTLAITLARVAEPRVTLRPFRPDELGVLWEQQQRDAGVFVFRQTSRAARRRLAARIGRSGRLVQGFLDLAVEAGGRLVGHVEARRPKQAMPPGVFELGIVLFEEERGKGYGRAAIELMTELLMQEHGAIRVQASTAVHNAAMRGVFERLGYTLEGVLRSFMPTADGGRDDYALYAVTRSDWDRDAAARVEASARRGRAE